MEYRFLTNSFRRAAAVTTLVALAALVVLVPVPAQSQTSDELRPYCDVCRRFADSSPSRIQAIFDQGKRSVTTELCSVFCYLEMLEDHEDDPPAVVRMVNHRTLGDEMELWLMPEKATFIVLTDDYMEKCNPPFAFAYQTRREAEAALEESDGELLTWDELVEIVSELTEEYEPESRKYRHSSNKRRPGS